MVVKKGKKKKKDGHISASNASSSFCFFKVKRRGSSPLFPLSCSIYVTTWILLDLLCPSLTSTSCCFSFFFFFNRPWRITTTPIDHQCLPEEREKKKRASLLPVLICVCVAPLREDHSFHFLRSLGHSRSLFFHHLEEALRRHHGSLQAARREEEVREEDEPEQAGAVLDSPAHGQPH